MRDFITKNILPGLDSMKQKLDPTSTVNVLNQDTGKETKFLLTEKFSSGASASLFKCYSRGSESSGREIKEEEQSMKTIDSVEPILLDKREDDVIAKVVRFEEEKSSERRDKESEVVERKARLFRKFGGKKTLRKKSKKLSSEEIFEDVFNPLAVKRMQYKTLAPDDPEEFEKLLTREKFALQSVCANERASRFVTMYYGHFYYPELDEHWLVMEFCDGGNLLPLRKERPNFKELAAISLQIMKGLEALHALGFIHSDIKTENILLKYPGIVKICDFGLAAKVKGVNDPEYHALGTIRYMSPEQMLKNIALDREDPNAEKYLYDNRIDVWAVGIILLELIIGRAPLHALRLADEDTFCRYIFKMCDLRRERNRGSGLGLLFYLRPDYKKFVSNYYRTEDDVIVDDLEVLLKRVPELKNNKKHVLNLLMRPQMYDMTPNPNEDIKMHPIKGLFLADKCFDFIGQCLFIDYLKRPSARDLQNHPFLRSANKEFTKLEPHLDAMSEEYKQWGKRKDFWRKYRCPLTIREVHNVLERQKKISKKKLRGEREEIN